MTEQELNELVNKLGGRLYIVGGYVRDYYIMGIEAHDKDYMITGLIPEQVPFDKIAGSLFPVFLVEIDGNVCEVALARSERKNGTGYHGFTFICDPSVTVEDDLLRRDFTMNAMAIDVSTGDIIDPFNGVSDIKRGVIRHVSEAFRDDPTRILRACRFAAKFGFAIANDTYTIMQDICEELYDVTAERVWKELEKVLELDTPSRFFTTQLIASVLHVWFPEIYNLAAVPDKHDGTAYNHTMTVMDAGTSPMERFGLLCHDLGKALTDPDKWPSHHGHDALGEQAVRDMCERIKAPNKWLEFGVKCATEHMKIKDMLNMRAGKILQWYMKHKNSAYDLIRVSYVDSFARDGADQEMQNNLFFDIMHRIELCTEVCSAVHGDQLIADGITPDKHFGEKLLQRRIARLKEIEAT